ncbi:MAG: Serine carboxypeptidase [Bradyrhizobium sp.]|nr:Serine carboxypeptidase [Bradyrhizobium sp.]
MMLRLFFAIVLATAAQSPSAWAETPPRPLVAGDEAIVTADHVIAASRGPLRYETRVGRLPIRSAETGEVHAWIFFTAYIAKNRGVNRPLAFAWNGGPTASSITLHLETLGPRRLTPDGLVDNPQTLLEAADLVFFDPVETGFSRPAKPEFAPEFLSTLGDFAETAEFIRAYRARFASQRQPLFLIGESYGTWRVSGVSEIMAQRGDKLAGVVLISGGVPGSQMSFAFSDAMYVPARTAAAFAKHRLDPELMLDREETMARVNAWVRSTYLPALEHPDQLTPQARESIALDLARYIGVEPAAIDRKTLVMNNRDYLKGFNRGDEAKAVNTFDMTIEGPIAADPQRSSHISDYLRGELGYATDLVYAGEEAGYAPVNGPAPRTTGSRWSYDHVEITPELRSRMSIGAGPPASQPWLQHALRLDPDMRVFVASGRYDSLNSCEGNQLMSAKLEPSLAQRFTHRCYLGGHMMYRQEASRLQLSSDLRAFIETASGPKRNVRP